MSAGPFVLAIAVSIGLVLSAPFVGQVRSFIRQAFPGHFVLLVGGLIAAGLGAALLAAVRRIRDRRGQRYGAITLAIVIATAYAFATARDNPESNVVELFHFLQYGLIAFLFYRAWRPAGDFSIVVLPVLAGVVVGSVEEWLQWFIPNRVGEVKDVFLNLVAVGTGLIFSLAVDPPRGDWRHFRPSSIRRVGRVAAVALITFAAFFHAVHLGVRVQDDEVGVFMSRWDRDRLVGLQAARAAAWKVDPPPAQLVRLSREDQYLTEGIQHVRWRNRRWDAGDIRAAWLENRILEKYYEPVLDTPTHEGAGHRWPAAQRTDAEARAATSSSGEQYVSDAYPYRLYTWPKPMLWLITLLVTAALMLGPARGFIGRTSD